MADRLPYQMIDFDTHSYETEDCFTRFMPEAKKDSAIQTVRLASGKKVLLANHKIVNALENDLDKAYVPGSLAEMLRQRSLGVESESERFFEDIKDEYLRHDARLAKMDEQQIERGLMYPGGWALMAEAYLEGVTDEVAPVWAALVPGVDLVRAVNALWREVRRPEAAVPDRRARRQHGEADHQPQLRLQAARAERALGRAGSAPGSCRGFRVRRLQASTARGRP